MTAAWDCCLYPYMRRPVSALVKWTTATGSWGLGCGLASRTVPGSRCEMLDLQDLVTAVQKDQMCWP
jgi:hypothetical protein